MRDFIKVNEFVNWFIHNCDEPFPIAQLERDFEACVWMPVDYLTGLLSDEAMSDLTLKVRVLGESQLEHDNSQYNVNNLAQL
jgi:hypothetical protein